MDWRWAIAPIMVGTAVACGGSTAPTTLGASPSPSATAAASARPDVDVALRAGDAPENPYAAFGSLWVVAHHARTVVRVDLASGRTIARIKTGAEEPGGITAGAGLLWVVHYGAGRTLVGIDPDTNKIVRRTKLPGESCCQPAVLGSTVWVTGGGEGSPAIVGVDARTGKLGRRIDGVDGPVVQGTTLWASREGRPVIVNASTGAVTETSAPAGSVMWASPQVDGLTWVTQNGAAVGFGADGGVKRNVLGPGNAKLTYTEGMAVTSGNIVWVVDGTSSLWRIDSGAETAVLAAHIAHDTLSIAGDGSGGVWVTLFDAARLQHFRAA